MHDPLSGCIVHCTILHNIRFKTEDIKCICADPEIRGYCPLWIILSQSHKFKWPHLLVSKYNFSFVKIKIDCVTQFAAENNGLMRVLTHYIMPYEFYKFVSAKAMKSSCLLGRNWNVHFAKIKIGCVIPVIVCLFRHRDI